VKILFFGTSSISKVFLENIDKKHQIMCVITKPDKPVGRGNKLTAPAVKQYATEHNIDYVQIEKFNDEIYDKLKAYNADAGVVVSYGKLIPERIFLLPKNKCFNIHFSKLPQYRGASPVQQALIDGQKQTAVTSFFIEKGLDTGDIILQDIVDIEENDTSDTLFQKLISCGIKTMNKTLDLMEQNKIVPKKQIGQPSFCSVFKKEDGRIKWNKSATEIKNLFRGLFLWPGIYCEFASGKLQGKLLKIIECDVVNINSNKEPGSIISTDKNSGFIVQCGKDCLLLKKVQLESKAKMFACDFINGYRITLNDKFI